MAGRRRRSKNKDSAVELNITAFMNLMVVLVPFLLMTAVFTNISILDLKLPSEKTPISKSDGKKKFDINIIVSKKGLILTDQNGGVIKKMPVTKSGYNYTLLNQTLRILKAKYPEKTSINILSTPLASYDSIIQVMDAVREYRFLQEGEIVVAELFPDISIGDAPQ